MLLLAPPNKDAFKWKSFDCTKKKAFVCEENRPFKFTPSDAEDGDFLYREGSVAISPTHVAVGAPKHDNGHTVKRGYDWYFLYTYSDEKVHLGLNSGAVYLFNIATGEETKLTASDGLGGDEFGTSVALSPTHVAVGAPKSIGSCRPRDCSPVTPTGSAYLFNLATGEETKLTASDETPSNEFGQSVAFSLTHVAVGARNGWTYLFNIATGQETKFMASDKINVPEDIWSLKSNYFGRSIALSPKYVVVGGDRGVGEYHDGEFNPGWFYNGPPIGTSQVSQPWKSPPPPWNPQPGSAYLFDIETGEESKLTASWFTASSGITDDGFGASVALSPTHVAICASLDSQVGADDAESRAGSVYILDLATGKETKLTASDGTGNDEFGTSIALSPTHVAVGAPGTQVEGRWKSGSAYVINLATGKETKLACYRPRNEGLFGVSIDISPTHVAVMAAKGEVYLTSVP
jgi:hypothetical protein